MLDIRTGKVLWHDQLVPEDDHDWDLTQVSPLITVQIDGRPRDLVITVGEGRPAARGRPRHASACLRNAGHHPLERRSAGCHPPGTHACPGVLGGVEWNGPAFNAGTNLLYVPAVDWCGTFKSSDNVRFIPGALYLGWLVLRTIARARGG